MKPPLPKSLLAGLRAASRGILWNSGSGLRLAVLKGVESIIAEHVRVKPCNDPEELSSRPGRVDELSLEVSTLRLGAR